MNRKPADYFEWRALYQHLLKGFGFGCYVDMKMRGIRLDHLLMNTTRGRWHQFRRLCRVNERLDEAMTTDVKAKLILEMIGL